MKSTIKRICKLQPQYSSSNTPEMQERGNLIRSDLTQELRDRIGELGRAFDPLFDDLAVEGSDGIGRKTEAPWVRLYSKAMSPTPREGFYLVIHFSADGLAFFVTIGCGSTIWSGGDLRPISDVQLKAKTSWARSVVKQRWGTLAPFTDAIALGARAPLPRTFEKATALARRIPVESIDSTDLDGLLVTCAERLGVPIRHLAAWNTDFSNNPSKIRVGVLCPICGQAELFRWHDGVRSLWEWCNRCGAFEHSTAKAPPGWLPEVSVKPLQPTALPTSIVEALREAHFL